MPKINKHIEIVSSTQSVLSSMSKESRDEIYTVLSRHYSRVGITIINNLTDLQALVALRPDLVFLGMKFIPLGDDLRGDDRIWLSDHLESEGISHTGSNSSAHELELNKHLSKQRMNDSGVMTSPSFIYRQNESTITSTRLTFPLFVKPNDRGGGLGIDANSVAYDIASMNSKIEYISSKLDSDSLVEEYLPGREFSVAVLKDEHSDEFSVMPIELVAPTDAQGHSMLSGKVKMSNVEQVHEVTDKTLRGEVCTLALEAFHALGARDYGRIDIRVDGAGVPHFLEANLLPSLIGGYGSFPKSCKLNLGLPHEAMVVRIANLGLAHGSSDTADSFEQALRSSFLPQLKLSSN